MHLTLDVITIIIFFLNPNSVKNNCQRRDVSDVNYRMKHEVGGWYERVNEMSVGIQIDDVLRGQGLSCASLITSCYARYCGRYLRD